MAAPAAGDEQIQSLKEENIRLQAQLDLMKEMYTEAIQR